MGVMRQPENDQAGLIPQSIEVFWLLYDEFLTAMGQAHLCVNNCRSFRVSGR
jgi:hypothetical protein